MLSRKLKINLNGLEVGTTPMLLPSLSSRINLDVQKTLETISEFIDGPLLISALDYHVINRPLITFPELIFLDSGGYECNKDQDVTDIGFYTCKNDWTKQMYSEVIDTWKNEIPTVLISYDHPTIRAPTKEQIQEAINFLSNRDGFLKEILFKPETKESRRIKPEKIIETIDDLDAFDIIGFTEKELGSSVLNRMVSIAKIRLAMDNKGLEKPIHIFGSLDTITTPLYYLAGADIFDGLSWLRYVYHTGNTLYLDSIGPKLHGVGMNINKIWIQSIYQNYEYLRHLKSLLGRFSVSGDFDLFGDNSHFFNNSYQDLMEEIGDDK